MSIILLIIVIITFFILYYEYRFANRIDTSDIQLRKNTVYGSYQIKQTYVKLMSGILLTLIAIIAALTFIYKKDFSSPITENERSEFNDTLFMNLEAPPIEPIKTINGPYSITNPDEEEKTTLNEEKQETDKEEYNSKSNNSNLNQLYEKNRGKNKSAEQSILDFEKELFENTGGSEKRDKLKKQIEEAKKQAQQQAGQQASTPVVPATIKKGKTLVYWELDNRTPHNNQRSSIVVPSYTCEQGSSGTVTLKIKVDANGYVVDAKITGKSTDVTPCIEEQSLKYAKMTRFSTSSSNNQEGKIEYTFVP